MLAACPVFWPPVFNAVTSFCFSVIFERLELLNPKIAPNKKQLDSEGPDPRARKPAQTPTDGQCVLKNQGLPGLSYLPTVRSCPSLVGGGERAVPGDAKRPGGKQEALECSPCPAGYVPARLRVPWDVAIISYRVPPSLAIMPVLWMRRRNAIPFHDAMQRVQQ